ncbi:MAG TPA: arsenate reductase (glutaredoxin) [Sphingomonadales bacterium]|nr:arsenate reductase (glutaredoxin) [Sphingomonadales bacterium]
MAQAVIWHNPRCSKSRAALALLEKRGVKAKVVLYLETPPSAADIKKALGLLRMAPRGLLRKGEGVYSRLGLGNPALTHAALIAAMARHPILIERPVVFCGRKAALGRPPEAVLEIL